jgi:hypothetical protein
VPDEGNRYLTYRELGERLIPYVKELGFTHIELLPITEYPFDGSWGYQPVSLFAPTSRFGTPEDFACFVEAAHAAGIGIILDWVPAHFPNDPHGLANFDGTALYEHADPRQGFHQDWGTYIYNFGRTEVAAFLVANARFWIERYHLDGLRVMPVASMLYLDYSRNPGEWSPNRYGGNENLEAIDFLRRMNESVYAYSPGVVTIAEESTAWPGVSRPTYTGGLGFGFKWNMGGCTTRSCYMSKEPDPPALPPPQPHLRPALRLLGELRPAAEPRRGRARQGLAARQDDRGPLAALREPARLLTASCGATRARSCCSWAASSARSASGTTIRASTGISCRIPSTRACSCSSATSTTPTPGSRPCTSATPSRAASSGSSLTTATTA